VNRLARGMSFLVALSLLLTACGRGSTAPPTPGSENTTVSPAEPKPEIKPADPKPTEPEKPFTPAVAVSAGVESDLTELNDEFGDPATLANWVELAAVEGHQSWIETLDVNKSSEGHMYLVPYLSSWFQDFRGVFLFKEVTGDFDVVTRVMTTGKQTNVPTGFYSVGGVMARKPRGITMDTWLPNRENWTFIVTGRGDDGAPAGPEGAQFETKSTTDSRSNVSITPSKPGWMELRLIRIGPSFSLLYRYDGDTDWQISRRYTRTDMPQTLQVGLNAYSRPQLISSPKEHMLDPDKKPGDAVIRFDYIRFQRPQVPDTLKDRATKLTDAELLTILNGSH